MTEHNGLLEIGLVAGLHVPTAMVLSEVEDKPPQAPKKKSKAGYVVTIIVGLLC